MTNNRTHRTELTEKLLQEKLNATTPTLKLIRPRLFVRVRMVKIPGYSYRSVRIARLFVRTRMVIVTGYSYGSVYTTGVSLFDEQT